MSTYREKLRDPRWQRKRLEVLQRDKWRCTECRVDDKPLHVHHVYYEKGKDPWDYPNEAFVALCDQCHDEEHAQLEYNKAGLIEEFQKMGFTGKDMDYLAMLLHTGMKYTPLFAQFHKASLVYAVRAPAFFADMCLKFRCEADFVFKDIYYGKQYAEVR